LDRKWEEKKTNVSISCFLSASVFHSFLIITLKPRNDDPFDNEIPAIMNLVLSPFVVNQGYAKGLRWEIVGRSLRDVGHALEFPTISK
jgi:hypothetical protein